jgi:RNA polymerase sigma-70 factor (ECF subfamily)
MISDLYASSADELSAYLRKIYGDGPPDPEDVAQQAFERLARYEDINGIKNLKAFLWRTARNLLLTHRRDSDTRSKYDYEIEHLFCAAKGSEASPQRVLEVRQQLNIIEKTLAEMPQKRRDAFLLHRVEGLTLTDTGKCLGVTRHAIVKHIARASVDIETALSKGQGGEE